MKYLMPIFLIVFLITPMMAEAFFQCSPECYAIPEEAGVRLCCLLDRVRQLLWYVGWFLALILLVIGGVMYMTSGGDQEKTDKAKKFITYAIVGIVIILASSFILSAIKQLVYPEISQPLQ